MAGALVTSTGSGLAVPDWPLSFGSLLPRMQGGVRFEHTHRLIAGAVLLLMLALAVRTLRARAGTLLASLVIAGLGAVVLQALLGGATVLLQIPPAVSVAHAGLAQAFFAIACGIAAVTGPGWAPAGAARPRPAHRRLFLATAALLYVQVLLGAVTRHLGAGRAFPDWPLSGGAILPALDDPGKAVNFAHRAGAWVTGALVLASAYVAWRGYRRFGYLRFRSLALPALLAVQFALGAESVWRDLPPLATALHVAVGALLVATAATLALRAVAPTGA